MNVTATPSSTGSRERLALLLPLALWALAVNPYVLPATYDNVTYISGARALASHGSYTLSGFLIADWPPGFSLVLAIPMALGIESLVVSKAIVLLFGAVALWLGVRLLRTEGRPYALLTMVLIGLLPTSLMAAVRVMSDWPYVALALATLLALDRIRHSRRPVLWGVVGGVLLGCAALTRHVGITLGAAIVAQAVGRMMAAPRGQRLRAVAPEALMAFIGAAAYLAWMTRVEDARTLGLAWAYYTDNNLHSMGPVDPMVVGGMFGDMFLRAQGFAREAGLPESVGSWVGLGLIALILTGAFRRIRGGGLRPSDWFIVATLGLTLPMGLREPRYLLPLAPFLVSDLLAGVAALAAAVRLPARAPLALAAAWMALSVGLDGWLIARGNGHSHGGLSPLASRTPEAFYQGEWRDLWTACAGPRAADHGTVLLVGRSDMLYPALFCERPVVQLDRRGPPVRGQVCAEPPFPIGAGWSLTHDGAMTPPLTAPPMLHTPADGSCPVRWVIVEAPASAPTSLPGVGPLAEQTTTGTMRLLTPAGTAWAQTR